MNGDTCDWCGEFLSNGYETVETFSGDMVEVCQSCKKEYDEAELEAMQGIYGGCKDCKDCGW